MKSHFILEHQEIHRLFNQIKFTYLEIKSNQFCDLSFSDVILVPTAKKELIAIDFHIFVYIRALLLKLFYYFNKFLIFCLLNIMN